MKVAFSARAQRDIDALFDLVLAERSARTALRLVDAIERRCLSLEHMPERGTLLGRDPAKGLRFTLEGRFVIVYRIVGSTVEIVAVLHGSRDLAALFGSSTS